MPLNDKQEALCSADTTDFSDLSAVLVNCTLKRLEERSHAELLLPAEIMGKCGVDVSGHRPVRSEAYVGSGRRPQVCTVANEVKTVSSAER